MTVHDLVEMLGEHPDQLSSLITDICGTDHA